ncbi:hypothetical protein [Phycisphaera mikurensis]|uniref:Uncharacterized protein n=1 Tax=Phycisphaera mikurensis (strain NBRC 102666 / KCTC 22515 / FYK2301M01) TaxID=1142394 RepID=I0IEA4_PHYMF|nr:hypothetical protein [Phycisphaera mikurensis]MBB6441394.1 hypothetical protein [Phycisphaera mikurensis]BAM03592.1 hypothetical protein PSMK_14330 [Phycisphaera mikurensis NBRC 102666]
MPALRYTNAVLTLLAVLLSANLWVLVSGPSNGLASEAHAQGVSNTAQRQVEILEEIKVANEQLRAINSNLIGGVKVEVVAAPGGE